MSKVIEIIDSEDDDNEEEQTSLPSTNPTDAGNDDNQHQQTRRRPRKSLVLPRMPDPEVQFETIALDDDNDSNSNSSPIEEDIPAPKNGESLLKPLQQRLVKTTPKILTPKPLPVDAAITCALEEYMKRFDAKQCLGAIANERVRINYLLSQFGMPEINFTLYTQPEVLKFQFEERLKQHKIMKNCNGGRKPEAQSNDEQDKN